ncbi:MAG: hypothetical protein AAF441_19505 [Pseudomonadota bacterium]
MRTILAAAALAAAMTTFPALSINAGSDGTGHAHAPDGCVLTDVNRVDHYFRLNEGQKAAVEQYSNLGGKLETGAAVNCILLVDSMMDAAPADVKASLKAYRAQMIRQAAGTRTADVAAEAGQAPTPPAPASPPQAAGSPSDKWAADALQCLDQLRHMLVIACVKSKPRLLCEAFKQHYPQYSKRCLDAL